MSVLICPVCQGTMKEVSREGVAIDTCTQCRGVWLDRGELEKLAAALAPGGSRPRDDRGSEDGARDWGDDDDRYRDRRGSSYRRKSKLSRLMELFD